MMATTVTRTRPAQLARLARPGPAIVAALALGLAALPAFASNYLVVFLIVLFVYVVLAASYDLVGGYMGYINIGHAAFFGVGAYAFAVAASRGIPLAPSVAAAPVAAAMLAVLVSVPLFRLRGVYFAIASLGLVVLVRQLALNLSDITSGVAGMTVPVSYDPALTYYLAFSLAAFCVSTNFALSRSRVGLALVCIRDDEDVADGTGVPILRYKILALAISAAFAGTVGAIFAWFLIFINPDSVFGPEIALTPIVMAMLGGTGTVLGPIVGATFLHVLQEVLWTNVPIFRSHLHLATYGLVLALVGLLMPNGIVRTRPVANLLRRIGL
jgi:branched-chain amino acid transport system permease protein